MNLTIAPQTRSAPARDRAPHAGVQAPAPEVVRPAWLQVVSHLDPSFGGLSAAVPELAAAVAAQANFQTPIAAFHAPGEPCAAAGHTVTGWPSSRLTWLRDRSLRQRFEAEIGAAAGVHIHGLWEESTSAAAAAARRARRPYILSAHGMLEPWALRNKRLKKQVYAALAEHRNVREADCLHALTAAEVLDYRRFGARQPIAILPNGVTIPPSPGPETFLVQFPTLHGKRIVLYLGRIHFKKGLDLLVESWSAVSRQFPDAHLVLAGPDSEGTRHELERRIAAGGAGHAITFTGMLYGGMKWSAFAAAEAFVLPSYSEGLPVSVLEAMGMGLLVVVTTHCHLPEITEAGAGWEIPSEVQALTSVLQELLQNSPETNRERGERGPDLISERFSWQSIGRKMNDLYLWLDGGPTPRDITIDTVQDPRTGGRG